MKTYPDFSLQAYNTFGIEALASQFAKVHSQEALQRFLLKNKDPLFILGGGSNLLITQDIKKLVLKNAIKGIQIHSETKSRAIVKIGGGENWHQFTQWCIRQDLGGVENLSLIPGTVGAAPIQNIGAYGVELKDVFIKLEAVELHSGNLVTFDHNDCQLDYRDSIFKKALKGQYFITHVYLELTKTKHQLNTSYGAINQALKQKGILRPGIQDISQAVIAIRSSKLPDPAVLGNSGSFFKNPVIPLSQLQELQKQFPDIVFYPQPKDVVKVPAGWLIERCGWKGKRIGNVGCYQHQALVLVNYGGATGQEIMDLAKAIMVSVQHQFGISLETEVNII